jgi:outer membrane protein
MIRRVVLLASLATSASAQAPRALSLSDAVGAALNQNPSIAMAEAGATRARGEVIQARSEFLPQLFGTASYTRTIKSQYEPLTSLPRDNQFQLCTIQLDSTASLGQRQAALAAAQSCPSQFSGNIFSSVGIGALNAYNLGLSFSQTLFNGQFFSAQRAASAPLKAADLGLSSARAAVMLEVAQAYYDAALADEMVAIADSTMAQDERTLQAAHLARRIGEQSEYDLLQTQVTRDNQAPVVVQVRNDRDQKYYRLKQLIRMPLDSPLTLTTGIEDETDLPGGIRLVSLNDSTPADIGDTAVDHRASVREQEYAVAETEALVSQSRAEYLPVLSLVSSYQHVAYPIGGLPAWNSFLTNWTVGVVASVPIFNGFKTHGDVLVAQADLAAEKARYQQTRELAALDARSAVADLRAAEAGWRAVSSSTQQAVQAYGIAEVRYRSGLSSLVELNASRIGRQQSFINRAQAARNLRVARMRVALLRDLPLAASSPAGAQAPPPQPPMPPQQPTNAAAAFTTGAAPSP